MAKLLVIVGACLLAVGGGVYGYFEYTADPVACYGSPDGTPACHGAPCCEGTREALLRSSCTQTCEAGESPSPALVAAVGPAAAAK